MRVDSAAQVVRVEGDEVVVSVRSRPAAPSRFVDDDESVVTSAAPLEETLRRQPIGDSKPNEHVSTPDAVSSAQAPGASPAASAPAPKAEPSVAPVPPALIASKIPAHSPPSVSGPKAQAAPPSAGPIPAAGAAPPAPSVPPPPGAKPVSIPRPASANVTHAGGAPPPRPPSPGLRPAPPAFKAPPPSPSATPPPTPAPLTGAALEAVDALADLPPELQERFAALARVVVLAAGEALSEFGVALVLEGEPEVRASDSDVPVSRPSPSTLLTTQGSLKSPLSFRVVAGRPGHASPCGNSVSSTRHFMRVPGCWMSSRCAPTGCRPRRGPSLARLARCPRPSETVSLRRLNVRVSNRMTRFSSRARPQIGLMLVCAGTVGVGDGVSPGVAETVPPGRCLFLRAATKLEPSPEAARAGESGAILLVGDEWYLPPSRPTKPLIASLVLVIAGRHALPPIPQARSPQLFRGGRTPCEPREVPTTVSRSDPRA